jgi:IS5 family transposase
MGKPRDDRQKDLLRPSLEEIIDLGHPLARLAREIDWAFLDGRFRSVCRAGAGQPPLPTRLVAGLLILKHMHDLSDEALCARWVENPYYQYFCGEESFQHVLPFDRSSLTRWRQRLGEDQLSALIQESLSVAHKTGALKTKDLERVAVDTTVQPKNVAFPTDARLLHKAIVMLAAMARKHGVALRQSYVRVAKRAALMAGRYAHAKQFKRHMWGELIRHSQRKLFELTDQRQSLDLATQREPALLIKADDMKCVLTNIDAKRCEAVYYFACHGCFSCSVLV